MPSKNMRSRGHSGIDFASPTYGCGESDRALLRHAHLVQESAGHHTSANVNTRMVLDLRIGKQEGYQESIANNAPKPI
jgi:hypothetical protein